MGRIPVRGLHLFDKQMNLLRPSKYPRPCVTFRTIPIARWNCYAVSKRRLQPPQRHEQSLSEWRSNTSAWPIG